MFEITEIKKLVSDTVMNTESGKTLFPVVVSYKPFFFSSERTVTAYPQSHFQVYLSGALDFYFYTDEKGNPLPDELCKRINNWLVVNEFKSSIRTPPSEIK